MDAKFQELTPLAFDITVFMSYQSYVSYSMLHIYDPRCEITMDPAARSPVDERTVHGCVGSFQRNAVAKYDPDHAFS